MNAPPNPVDLTAVPSSTVGHPVRASFVSPKYNQRLARVYGNMEQVVSGSEMLVCCMGHLPELPADTRVVVEALVQGELVFLFTTLASPPKAGYVRLTWPHETRTQQRRQHPRVDTALPLYFRITGSNQTDSGQIENLSVGGLAFTSTIQVQKGNELEIAFGLGSGCYFDQVRIEVVRCEPALFGGYQIGGRFLELDPNVFQRLNHWVYHHLNPTKAM